MTGVALSTQLALAGALSCGSATWKASFLVFHRHLHDVARFHGALEQLLGERILEVTLDGAPHRTRAISRIVSLVDHEFVRRLVEHNLDLLQLQAALHLVHFQIDDLHQIRLLERVEDNDLIEPIQKLRLKDALRLLENLVPHHVVILPRRAARRSPSSSGA